MGKAMGDGEMGPWSEMQKTIGENEKRRTSMELKRDKIACYYSSG